MRKVKEITLRDENGIMYAKLTHRPTIVHFMKLIACQEDLGEPIKVSNKNYDEMFIIKGDYKANLTSVTIYLWEGTKIQVKYGRFWEC